MRDHLLILTILALSCMINIKPTSCLARGMEELKGTGTYGQAGCGLGSMVFSDEPGFNQIIAATLNVSTGTQTLGMTTGTSNCGPSVYAKEKIQQFIVSNNIGLETDIARGGGETLDSLNQLLGCDPQFFNLFEFQI